MQPLADNRFRMPDLMLQLVLVLLLPACRGQFGVENVGVQNVGCPAGKQGLYPDPSSCTFYYECSITASGPISTRHQCPSETPYFRPSASPTAVGFGFCDRTRGTGSALCQQQDIPILPQRDVLIPGLHPNPVTLFPSYPGYDNVNVQGRVTFACPRYLVCNRTSLNGLYGDPTSCTRFYLCVDYTLTVFNCPAGMQFSDSRQLCDFAYRARCDLRRRQSERYYCGACTHFQVWTIVISIGLALVHRCFLQR